MLILFCDLNRKTIKTLEIENFKTIYNIKFKVDYLKNGKIG